MDKSKTTPIQDFRSDMLGLLLKDAKLSELLHAGYKVLGNPLILFNHRGEVLSISEHQPYNNPEWENAEQSCYYSKSEFTKLISNDFEKSNPHTFSTNVPNQRCIITLLPGMHTNAYLMMLESESVFHSHDGEFLFALAGSLAIKLRKRKKSNTLWIDTHELFISNLLLGRINEELTARQYAKNFGIWVIDDLTLLTGRSSIKLGEHELNDLSPQLLEIFPGCKTSVYNGDLIILLFDPSYVSYNSQPLLKARSFFRKKQLQVCVSNPFRRLIALRDHYQSASSTLQICSELHIKKEIIFYNQYVLDNLLWKFQEKELRMMCHPGVMELYKVDKAQETQNILHLYAYTLMCGNRSDASRILNIATNTFKYRMKDMENYLGSGYSKRLSHIYISIKILLILFPYDMDECRKLESMVENLRK